MKRNEATDFWAKMHASLSKKEAHEYNEWRHQLYVAADNVRTCMESVRQTVGLDSFAEESIRKLMEQVCKPPCLVLKR